MNIIIDDDQRTNLKVVEPKLKTYGKLTMTQNGALALQFFKEGLESGSLFDLVLLDIMMPVMDGHTTLLEMRALKRKHKVSASEEAKIIMLSTMDTQNHMDQALKMGGASGYIVKQPMYENLVDRLKQLKIL